MLWIEDADVERASWALDSYDRENAERARPQPKLVEHGPSNAGFITALGLVLFHILVNETGPTWYEEGRAHSFLILSGEVWRVVTALTLHSGLPHLLGNTASCVIFVTALCRWIGPGPGLSLTLTSGALGNWINAWAQSGPHVSVGASTALFGSIGVLSGMAFVYRRELPLRRGRAWIPLAGGLGLLAMLGTGGENTDVSAHLFGLASGSALGIAWGYGVPKIVAAPGQAALGIGSLAVLSLCWFIALA
ncbi:MAG: rhomboid family intramembrane serine protease [bacterium]|nr:rhomboid family intramembrane serine protease [bacterium]